MTKKPGKWLTLTGSSPRVQTVTECGLPRSNSKNGINGSEFEKMIIFKNFIQKTGLSFWSKKSTRLPGFRTQRFSGTPRPTKNTTRYLKTPTLSITSTKKSRNNKRSPEKTQWSMARPTRKKITRSIKSRVSSSCRKGSWNSILYYSKMNTILKVKCIKNSLKMNREESRRYEGNNTRRKTTRKWEKLRFFWSMKEKTK